MPRGYILDERKHKTQASEHRQKRRIVHREQREIPEPERGILLGERLVGDEACHGRDERAQPAQIAADDERLPLRRKARKQERRGHVAYHLAGENRDYLFVAGYDRGQKVAEDGNVAHIAYEYEERDERAQQRIIDPGERMPVEYSQKYRNDDGDGDHRHDFEQPQQADDKEHRRPDERKRAAERALHLHFADGRALEAGDDCRQSNARERDVWQHYEHELAERHARLTVQIQVLRVADGRERAAHVCRERLQHYCGHYELFEPRGAQNYYGKRHERYERHVVGDRHAEKERQKDKHRHELF